MAFSMRLARNTIRKTEFSIQSHDIPTFLCPALLNYSPHSSTTQFRQFQRQRSSLLKVQQRCLHLDNSKVAPANPSLKLELPILCTGCGAYAQTYDEEKPGFYSLNRKSIKAFLQGKNISEISRRREEDNLVLKSLQNADSKLVESLNIEVAPTTTSIGRFYIMMKIF